MQVVLSKYKINNYFLLKVLLITKYYFSYSEYPIKTFDYLFLVTLIIVLSFPISFTYSKMDKNMKTKQYAEFTTVSEHELYFP